MREQTPALIQLGALGTDVFGYLTVAENNKEIPFAIQRVYWTYRTPTGVKRGMHAHKKLQQVLFAISGKIDIELDNGKGKRVAFALDTPGVGLYVPQMWWRDIFFGENAVLLSLASELYDAADYYRDFEEFAVAAKAL